MLLLVNCDLKILVWLFGMPFKISAKKLKTLNCFSEVPMEKFWPSNKKSKLSCGISKWEMILNHLRLYEDGFFDFEY